VRDRDTFVCASAGCRRRARRWRRRWCLCRRLRSVAGAGSRARGRRLRNACGQRGAEDENTECGKQQALHKRRLEFLTIWSRLTFDPSTLRSAQGRPEHGRGTTSSGHPKPRRGVKPRPTGAGASEPRAPSSWKGLRESPVMTHRAARGTSRHTGCRRPGVQ
jgi:hypothetical protein